MLSEGNSSKKIAVQTKITEFFKSNPKANKTGDSQSSQNRSVRTRRKRNKGTVCKSIELARTSTELEMRPEDWIGRDDSLFDDFENSYI